MFFIALYSVLSFVLWYCGCRGTSIILLMNCIYLFLHFSILPLVCLFHQVWNCENVFTVSSLSSRGSIFLSSSHFFPPLLPLSLTSDIRQTTHDMFWHERICVGVFSSFILVRISCRLRYSVLSIMHVLFHLRPWYWSCTNCLSLKTKIKVSKGFRVRIYIRDKSDDTFPVCSKRKKSSVSQYKEKSWIIPVLNTQQKRPKKPSWILDGNDKNIYTCIQSTHNITGQL